MIFTHGFISVVNKVNTLLTYDDVLFVIIYKNIYIYKTIKQTMGNCNSIPVFFKIETSRTVRFTDTCFDGPFVLKCFDVA